MSGDIFSKPYDPKAVEPEIYKKWEESGYFNPDNLPGERKDKFSMVLPPPNVTGTLHIGHALTFTIQDIIIRYQRMRGKKTLWIPGTDHASIATETKFLKEKKISRNDYINKRDEFIKLVNEFALQNQIVIIKQLRAMGSSLDWSRLAFTLDEKREKAVNAAFKQMYDAGLIYTGEYLVNWDPKGQTTVSDEEIEHEAAQGTLYTFKYSKDFPIPIATTRPETKLGDTAVAVHPKGKWKEFIGKKFDIEDFAGVSLKLEIVGDETVDPEFGTGAVGITPAHSRIDQDIAKRHNLPTKQVINEYGKIIHARPDWDEKINIKDAREKIIEWLRKESLLEKEEIIEHNIAKAQRSGGPIEILPKRHQFFVDVNKPISDRGGKTLKDLMHDAIANKKIKIIPENFEKIYLHWIENLRDWNISRQVWYGHTIPDAWYKGDDIVVRKESPGEGWNRITDTFDTWFSSGLWTFSALGWPEQTADLKTYHPTDVLETGYDILFFWVARMILMSTLLLNQVPFHTVYLHGLVRDENRRKMSKSLGNVIDPLDMAKKYGTDALRMALIFNTSPGTDSSISEQKIKGMKNFANKLWNIARFVLENTTDVDMNVEYSKSDKVVTRRFEIILEDITKQIDNYRLDLAAESLYHFIWHELADRIIEVSKPIFRGEHPIEGENQKADPKLIASRKKLLLSIFKDSLKLLHPFMPFITEEIWGHIPKEGERKLLMIEEWPKL